MLGDLCTFLLHNLVLLYTMREQRQFWLQCMNIQMKAYKLHSAASSTKGEWYPGWLKTSCPLCWEVGTGVTSFILCFPLCYSQKAFTPASQTTSQWKFLLWNLMLFLILSSGLSKIWLKVYNVASCVLWRFGIKECHETVFNNCYKGRNHGGKATQIIEQCCSLNKVEFNSKAFF